MCSNFAQFRDKSLKTKKESSWFSSPSFLIFSFSKRRAIHDCVRIQDTWDWPVSLCCQINQSFCPADAFSLGPCTPLWRKQGRKILSLARKPSDSLEHMFNSIFFRNKAEATQGSSENLCKCQTTQIFLISIIRSLNSNYDFLQTACNESSYILSLNKNK